MYLTLEYAYSRCRLKISIPVPKLNTPLCVYDNTMESSSEDENTVSMEETATRLLSLVNGVVTDFGLVQTKVAAAHLDIFKQDVRPLRGVMLGFWDKMSLPPVIPFNALLERIYETAKRLDIPKREIHFSDEIAPLFGKSYMTLFELVDIIIDSLEFIPVIGSPV